MYSGIGGGKTSVTVTWNVYSPGKNGSLISKLSVPLEIDIPPATPERLAALRKRMEEQLRRPGLSDKESRRLVDDILDTRHPALAPVAWRMIEAPHPPVRAFDLIQFISECPEDSSDLDGRLAKLAEDRRWGGRWDLFDYWRNRKTELPPAAWQTLNDAESVWTRALTYVVFPKRCGKEWKAALLQDLHDQSKPLRSTQLDRLLTDLDADDFDVREKASALLARFGERVEGQLSKALDGPLSAEAGRRVTTALEQIRKAKQPPDCIQALEYFGAHDAPENGELLQVLADGEPDAWLTQQAKGKLAEWRRNHALSNE